MSLESKFEELENMINNEVVREKVSDLKNTSIKILEALIEVSDSLDNFLYNEFSNSMNSDYLEIVNLIEKETGKKWQGMTE